MERYQDEFTMPVGPGGAVGRIGRIIVMLCTGGMAFPNVFVEGMNLTEIQKRTEGALYDKKPKDKK